LEGEVEKYFKNLIKEIADDKGFIIESMEVMPDHVHIFASAHPKISPSYIVKMLKGITGRKIFMNFPEIKSKLYKGTLWNSSFYIETVGSVSQEAVEKYIETQKERK
jgi:putative transposase